MDTFRELNAAIKAEFKNRDGFKSAKTTYVGSIPAVRFAGDMPVSLAYDIARWIERNHEQFVRPDAGSFPIRHISFVEGAVVLNWA